MRSFRLVTATVVLLSALVALAESTDEIIARYPHARLGAVGQVLDLDAT